MDVHIYAAVDSKSQKESAKKYGYVLECEVNGSPYTKEGFGDIVATYNGACITAITAAVRRINADCTLYLHIDCNFVLSMIKNNLETWDNRGYVTTKGEKVANYEMWQQLWPLIKGFRIIGIPGKHQYSDWMSRELWKG